MTTGKIKFASLGLIFFIFMNPYNHGEKKDVGVIADGDQINPLHENAVDFLEFDYEQLRLQAAQLAREKKYFEAAQCYLTLLKFNRNDSTSIYNLACCYGRLRQAGLAVKSLVMALRTGFHDFMLLKKDPDFTLIRETPEFIKLLEWLADWEDNLGETLHVKTSKLLELRVKVPRKFDPTRTVPLLIGLHGNGGNPEQMMAAMNQALKKEPLILAAPQGAYANFPQLRGQHFSWEIQTRDRELWKIGDPLVIENIVAAAQLLTKKYPISGIYLLGFSQGAAYAFLSGFKHPEQVTGIISIGGLFPDSDTEFSVLTEADIAKGKNIRVFIAQGSHDHAIPAGLGAQTAERLKKYRYEVEYREYEGGHEISPELLKEIYAWMMKR
jgi:phospholipase/carboxylesterase